jgi:hypothetical protein
MANWKRVVGFASLGAGAMMCLKGKRSAGAILAAVGAIALVSEYPDEIRSAVQKAPVWLDRTNRVLAFATQLADRFADV